MTANDSPESVELEQPNGEAEKHETPFPVVGVGASAGGLEAFIDLLGHLPAEPGLAFLFVQHIEASHKSSLAEILGKITPMPVAEAVENTRVQVNHVYIIPPNQYLAMTDGTLSLSPRAPRGPHMPVDHLFRSLANVHRARAIGVILSGGGTDGTLGFHAIKAEGGITFAQDEKTAKQDGMPRSAVAEGSVDYVLPPGQIAAELLRIARHPYTREVAPPDGARPDNAQFLNQVISLLRARTEVDFTHYKRSTIWRRIQRRMALRNLEKLDEYLAALQNDPVEQHNLYQDFLIRVTQFFRDPEAFEALKEKVFPALVQERPADRPIRLWVAGCSTGEEVYSLAMVLLEFLGGRADHLSVKILATDLNEVALERARAGLYIDNIEMDVSTDRLRRFFTRVDSHYQISKAVRDLCVFSRHNMASDPPFSHLDLVSCRNVMIYMDGALQRRVLPILHYALNPDGFLFLGSSETIGSFGDLFVPVDAKQRIFQKKPAAGALPVDFSGHAILEATGRAARGEAAPVWSAHDVQREADRIVLNRYAPVGAVVDEALTVLQFRGRTAPYLEPAPGLASLDLLRMLRDGLLAEVRGAVARAKAEDVPVTREGVSLTDAGRTRTVKLEVIPFKVPPAGVRFFLVLFQDMEAAPLAAPSEAAAAAPAAPGANAQQLQQELNSLREYLQTVVEEQESTNEELKSANEEILSANEELQSTNEELQTAKEEAQSANEELATVNDELRHRNAELARVNNDLVNLLSGVNIPIVMVGRDLRIRRFTPLAEKLFNLIPTDMGRPISDIKPNLRVEDPARLIARVIDTLAPHESEVQDSDGHWYSLRIRPYVTLDNKIDGASVVLVDIDSVRRQLQPQPVPPTAGKPPAGA